MYYAMYAMYAMYAIRMCRGYNLIYRTGKLGTSARAHELETSSRDQKK